MAAKKPTSTRLGSNPPPSQLAKFRRDVAKLQKQGLIPGKPVKSSTARPLQIRGGKHLSEYVKAYQGVLSGKAGVVKLPRAAVIEQHKMGHKSAPATSKLGGGLVIVPKAPGERLRVTKSGAVERIDTVSGLKVIDIPVRLLMRGDIKRAVEVGEEAGGGGKYWGYKMAGHKGTIYSAEGLGPLLRAIKRHYKSQIGKYGWNKFHDTISILSSDNLSDLHEEKGRAR